MEHDEQKDPVASSVVHVHISHHINCRINRKKGQREAFLSAGSNKKAQQTARRAASFEQKHWSALQFLQGFLVAHLLLYIDMSFS